MKAAARTGRCRRQGIATAPGGLPPGAPPPPRRSSSRSRGARSPALPERSRPLRTPGSTTAGSRRVGQAATSARGGISELDLNRRVWKKKDGMSIKIPPT
ncbi:unnamed protein product [Prorocentrum cordatum]|uniref:Uncharacterized protein n=1 Tax=Prorocentrum cordatum TaxID=2364126 RepID=A0ABN9XF11_9DINO|nr:unnamed protein product [Polarella glacialis]